MTNGFSVLLPGRNRSPRASLRTLERRPPDRLCGLLANYSGAGRPAIPRKEVIQPHLPVRLPCYDFVPVANPTFDGCLLAVGPPASGVTDSHDVTGGVYKAREHIHRGVMTRGY